MMSSEEDEGVMSNDENEGEGRESDGDNNDGDEEAVLSSSLRYGPSMTFCS